MSKYIVASVDFAETLAWDFAEAASADEALEIVTRARCPVGHAVDAWTSEELFQFGAALAMQAAQMKPAEIQESLRLSREYADSRLATLVVG